MKEFTILSEDLDIHQHTMLEASAGTGKTFSIENIVVRLLVEEPSCVIEEMLLVTFTRAATRDLKLRVRAAIEHARQVIFQENAPGYLKLLPDKEKAKKKLEQALFCFDQAQIFTIHGFCKRMLAEYGFTAGVSLSANEEEDQLPPSAHLQIIRDFFRAHMRLPNYHPVEVQHLLKEYRGVNKLERAALTLLMDGKTVCKQPTFEQNATRFQEIERQNLLRDFQEIAPCFKGLYNRQKEIKEEILQSLLAIEEGDFVAVIENQLPWLDALNTRNLKAKSGLPNEHLLQRFWNLKAKFLPLISPLAFFSRMVADCQELLNTQMKTQDKFRFDDLLKQMLEATKKKDFTQKIQEKYRVAIVDEFQDTDPIQWEIFQKIFLSNAHYLYLVGDPKQSIYAFRNADIYTYLKAKEALGEPHLAHLTTNYRSDCQLVDALNTLFCDKNVPHFIALPKLQKSLPYIPVKAGGKVAEKPFSDKRGSIHFMVCEDPSRFSLEALEKDFFFPFIADEIKQLPVSFEQIALLVSDRYQADRLAAYLQTREIPASLQRHQSLSESPALAAIREVLEGIVNPKSEPALKRMLGTRIVGWSCEQMEQLSIELALEKVYFLRELLFDKGFCHFFPKLLNTQWLSDGLTARERLLGQVEGKTFLRELHQIAEQMMDFENQTAVNPEKLLLFLDQFPLFEFNQEAMVKAFPSAGEKAVSILTMHASKGLEFDIVFALGVVKPTKKPFPLIPKGEQLVPIFDLESKEYGDYCEEIDAEKMRQLYVAFTRAKHRLYIPAIHSSKEPLPGCGSPQELFFSKCRKNFDEICLENPNITLTKMEEWKPRGVGFAVCSPPVVLVPPRMISHSQTTKQILSFTSLTKSEKCQAALHTSPPRDWLVEEKTVHTLPAGSETGNLLHKILETYSFGGDIASHVQSHIAGTEAEGWEDVIVEIVAENLQVNLKHFRLADVDPNLCFREMEFLYPEKGDYLKGVIDLTFFHCGKYYLLDWKSNWLGPDKSYYTRASLETAMKEHHYFLQAEIYKKALQQYLALVDPKPFSEVFGGVFYVFLRGGVYEMALC